MTKKGNLFKKQTSSVTRVGGGRSSHLIFPRIVFPRFSDELIRGRRCSTSTESDDVDSHTSPAYDSSTVDRKMSANQFSSELCVSLTVDTSAENVVKLERYRQVSSAEEMKSFIKRCVEESSEATSFLPSVFGGKPRPVEPSYRSEDNPGRAMLKMGMCAYHRSYSVAQSVSEDRISLSATRPEALLGWQILLLTSATTYLGKIEDVDVFKCYFCLFV